MTPIRLYYWHKPNFGDAMSADVVAHVSGRPVQHVPLAEAEMVAVGSLLPHTLPALVNAPRDVRPVLWGTGCIGPGDGSLLRRVDIAALRGPITASLMAQAPATPFGDPGIFAADLLKTRPALTGRIGLVPHWTQADDGEIADLVRDLDLQLIDPRTGDAISVIRQIAACRFILTNSLHGMIVADSLGVPNEWLNPAGIHSFATLKFLDYAASVGRFLGAPLDLDQVGAYLAGTLPDDLPYQAGILAAKAALRHAFPAHLLARAA